MASGKYDSSSGSEDEDESQEEQKLIETVGRTTVDLVIPEVKKRKVDEVEQKEEFSIDNLLGKRAKMEEKTWPEREADLTSKVAEYTRRFREVQKLDGMVCGGVSINLLGSDALVTERASAIKAAEKVDRLLSTLEECAALSAWIYKKQKSALQGVAGEKRQDEEEVRLVGVMEGMLSAAEGIWGKSRQERKARKEAAEEERKREEKERRKKEEADRAIKHLDKIKKKANDTEGKVWDPRLKMYREKGDADESWRDH
ncbi:hypothetical protein TrRE_jg7926 [Triparma retinervis]|uniref:Uncharacterized protein n=1 Tax=Triparma retinervis TaxID=2557542 RepID=A0A9W7DMP0_9STRA|nr:hypothetical protein TrRE_jg7926 [Triparma retinervis]